MSNEATQVEPISLDEALAPEPTGAQPETVATPEVEAEKPAETGSTATPVVEKKEEAWHLTAVLDEREKRQAAQRELEALKKELEATKTPKQKTSVLDDEGKFRNELMDEFRTELMNDRLNLSQAFAEREFGKDVVAAKVEAFKALAAENPELRNKFSTASLPYHELVSIVNKHEELKQMENVDAYKEKLRAEVRAEILKESTEKTQAEAKKRESITPSLASKRSAGGTKDHGSLFTLDDILKS